MKKKGIKDAGEDKDVCSRGRKMFKIRGERSIQHCHSNDLGTGGSSAIFFFKKKSGNYKVIRLGWPVGAPWDRFPSWHAQIHWAEIVPRWPVLHSVLRLELVSRDLLVLGRTFFFCGVPGDLHRALGPSHGGRGRGSGSRLGRSGW